MTITKDHRQHQQHLWEIFGGVLYHTIQDLQNLQLPQIRQLVNPLILDSLRNFAFPAEEFDHAEHIDSCVKDDD